jgi:hypothetical protein
MGREGDHERAISDGAEGQAKAPATAAALDLAATAAVGAFHKAHALVIEHRWRSCGHDADRRDALLHQRRRHGSGFAGGIHHQPSGCRQLQGLPIGRIHRVVAVGPGRPQMPCGHSQLQQPPPINAQGICRIGPLITSHAVANQHPPAGRALTRLMNAATSSPLRPSLRRCHCNRVRKPASA